MSNRWYQYTYSVDSGLNAGLPYYYNVETGAVQWEHPGPDALVTAVSLGTGPSTGGACISGDGLVAQLASEIHDLCDSDTVRTHGQREIVWKTTVKSAKPPPAPPFPDPSPVDLASSSREPSSGSSESHQNLAIKRRKIWPNGLYDDLPVRIKSVIYDIVNDTGRVLRLDQDRFEARLEDFRAGGLDEDYFYHYLIAERDSVDVKNMATTTPTMDSRAETREVVESAFIAVERCNDPKQLTDILALCDIDCSTSLMGGYTILMTAAVLHRPEPIISVLASWPFTCRADVVNPYTGDNVFHMLVRDATDIITERRFTEFVNAYVGAKSGSVPSHVKSAMNQYTRMNGGATPVLLAVMPLNGVIRTDTMVARLVGRLHSLGAECTQPLLSSGDTPLHFACKHGYRKTVELLLSAGATSKENKAGERPEDVTDNVTILELLRNAASATVS